MQTFLPLRLYRDSVNALDTVRLNKQILECQQIFRVLIGDSEGYQHHPAVRMWRKHELSLLAYGGTAAAAYRDRRGESYDKRQVWFYEMSAQYGKKFGSRGVLLPPWIDDPDFHASHRSNLIRKDPAHYTWDEPSNLPYLWPVTAQDRSTYSLYVSEADRKRLETGERILPKHLRLEGLEVVDVDGQA